MTQQPTNGQRNGRRWAVRGSAALVAVLVAAGTIGAAHAADLTGITARPAGRTVTPVPADASRVCAGGLLQLADASGADATTASRVGHETVAAASTTGQVHRSTLAAASSGGSDPTVVTARAGRTTPTVAGSGIQEADGDEVAGLAAAACDDPSTSSWLVGGSTETGRTSIVTLANPTDVNATVDLDVFTTTGKVSAPGTTGIVVAPNTQKVVPLAGFVSDAASPVVHVTSSGGQIVATMQESIVRTLTPGGADVVQAAATPSRTQTIPGVVLRDTDGAQHGDDTADAAPVVRVFVPGDASAHLTMALTTADGGGTTVQATADGGVVTDVPLDDFADGRYTVTVTADVPIVAGARTSTPTTDGRTDLGWFASAPTLTGTTLVDVVDGPGARLTLVNPTTSDATVTMAAGGERTTVTVAAGTTADTTVPTSTALTLRGVRGLVAGVSYAGDAGIAGFPLRPGATASTPITVYP
ncbi:hypothetical protein DEI81_05785 [Curtobacterium sp. MCBD17_013]|uniref:DUF5719 family protein n=1 Tax=Curtobacterium sp. MCBD17_013 TaxID=2175668 RepID=UPI000DA8F01D|nr:DUF5719 family protein [Curtobacterium sp. MCBD17_013]PZF64456.1 hypothetical protein DEI81_05785 [Curtobacterium sp. MCBD17_013]